MSDSNIAHPGDSRFHWVDEVTGEKMSALWVKTSDDSRLSDFKYKVSEHIQGDIYSKRLVESIDGFKMLDTVTQIEDLDLRDDAFTSDHSGKYHVLFAGCSITWGTGLEKGERWIDLAYKEINNNKECSGLFNVAQEGDGIQSQVGHIVEYVSKYGKPDLIMFNIPDFWRLIVDDGVYRVYSGEHSNYSSDSLAKMLISTGKHYYKMLQDFCVANEIKLISFSWDTVTNNILKDFSDFIYIDKDYLDRLTFKYDDGGEYSMQARDGLHPGTAANKSWSEIVINNYRSRT